MVLPIFATPIAAGYLFFTIFYEEGGPLSWTGIPWLSDPDWALVSIIIVDVWQWTPFAFLVFLAALQGIDEEQIQAARPETSSERSEEHTSELQSLMRISYAVFCLTKQPS